MSSPTESHEDHVTEVLARISGDRVHMRSRAHFVLMGVLRVALFALALLAAVFIASFAFVVVRLSGVLTLLQFGPRGARVVVGALPWTLVVAAVVCLVAAVLMARRVPAVYRRPLMISAVAFALGIALLAVLLAHTPFHRFLRMHGGDRWPLIGDFYRSHRVDRVRGALVGTVTTVAEDRLLMDTADGPIAIRLDGHTHRPSRPVVAGDRIIVIGDRTSDGMRAFGVRRIVSDPDDTWPGIPMPMHSLRRGFEVLP